MKLPRYLIFTPWSVNRDSVHRAAFTVMENFKLKVVWNKNVTKQWCFSSKYCGTTQPWG